MIGTDAPATKLSMIGEGTDLDHGMIVVQGSSNSQVKSPQAAADVVRGLLTFNHAIPNGESLEGGSLTILSKGQGWVKVLDGVDVVKDDEGHVYYTAANRGLMTNATVADNTLAVSGKFLTDVNDEGLALFEFDV